MKKLTKSSLLAELTLNKDNKEEESFSGLIKKVSFDKTNKTIKLYFTVTEQARFNISEGVWELVKINNSEIKTKIKLSRVSKTNRTLQTTIPKKIVEMLELDKKKLLALVFDSKNKRILFATVRKDYEEKLCKEYFDC